MKPLVSALQRQLVNLKGPRHEPNLSARGFDRLGVDRFLDVLVDKAQRRCR